MIYVDRERLELLKVDGDVIVSFQRLNGNNSKLIRI